MIEPQSGRRIELNTPIRVVAFSREVCPFSNADHSWQQFYASRNGVLDILSSYGTFGPTGKMPILDSYEASRDARRNAHSDPCPNPDFFVVDDDMYGMSVRVEADRGLIKPAVLEELVMFLKERRSWCVYLALIAGGLWTFHDRILFEGTFFAGCGSVEDIYNRCGLARQPEDV